MGPSLTSNARRHDSSDWSLNPAAQPSSSLVPTSYVVDEAIEGLESLRQEPQQKPLAMPHPQALQPRASTDLLAGAELAVTASRPAASRSTQMRSRPRPGDHPRQRGALGALRRTCN